MIRFLRRQPEGRPVEQTGAATARFLDGGTGKFGLEVVGESNYQKAIKRALAGARLLPDNRTAIDIIARREPANPYDLDAVQILNAVNGDRLGYLSRDRAKQYRRTLSDCAAAGFDVRCTGVLAGDASIGVWLDLAFPSELSKRLKAANAVSS